ncbi:MAG: quinone-dependent dihydroorotate dehydrogenase [Bacteroidetes bacterium SW_9_63_38]|nr:MAG: quinone-dependent dihydroorotate dehydrogenase [Bacteroidetes bacterium SW_9_63_38]
MYRLVRPLLFRMDPERAHSISLGAAEFVQRFVPSVIEPNYAFEEERLKQRLWGSTFPNPVGLAAGADKNARLVPFWESVGFGFVEVGSVSAMAADGNPKPRAFRLEEDRALLNRLGLNNEGAAAVAERLDEGKNDRTRPLGINLAKTHDPGVMGDAAREDFRESFRLLAPQAEYIVLNVSCPNTETGRTFEHPDALDDLLSTIFAEQKASGLEVPVLIKLSPPVSDRVLFDTHLEDVIAVAQAHGVHGFIASNTASDRKGVTATSQERLEDIGEGGLSGEPLAGRATCLVRYLYQATDGEIPIIGVGGVHDAASAYEKIRAGASLVQLYTALVYEGPGLVKRIKEGLVECLKADGHASIADAVGVDA